jgi:hypothetical protein
MSSNPFVFKSSVSAPQSIERIGSCTITSLGSRVVVNAIVVTLGCPKVTVNKTVGIFCGGIIDNAIIVFLGCPKVGIQLTISRLSSSVAENRLIVSLQRLITADFLTL